MRTMVYSGLARLAGFVPAGIAVLLTSHLIIKHYGLEFFDSYALILSVILLIPLSNLGMGTALTQAIAAGGPADERSLRAGVTATRVLLLSGLFLTAVALGFGLPGLWPKLLGDASGPNSVTVAALIIYALSFTPSLGNSVLLATGHNHYAVSLQSMISVLALAIVGVLIATDGSPDLLVVIPSTAVLAVSLVSLLLSVRPGGFPWATVLARVPNRRMFPGERTRSLSFPMFVVSVAIPIAFLSDRIVLSHVSTQAEVAKYVLVLQIFAPVTGLIVATSQPLWPMFTRARVEGGSLPKLKLILGIFLAGTTLISVVLVLISNWMGNLISGDKISLGYGLPALAAAVTIVQAIAFPLTMSMVDPRGIRLVAICSTISVPANIGLSIWLAREWGAVGPLVAALIVGIGVQTLPFLVFVRRRQHSEEPVELF